METRHFLSRLQTTVLNQWNEDAMTDIDGTAHYTYAQVANEIEKMHAQFKALGLNEGDKIALCGRNCAAWAITFLAISTYKAVAVSILPDFTSENIHNMVNHSDAKLLFVGPNVKAKIDPSAMTNLIGIVFMDEFAMYSAKDENSIKAFNKAAEDYKAQYPAGFPKDKISYPTDNIEDLALINYTSGTTSSPKGVMLSNRNLSANVDFGATRIPHKPGDRALSMLPIGHMFGLMYEFLYQICDGAHIFFLTKAPSPTTLLKSLTEVQPFMILTVPLVIEKIVRKAVLPKISTPAMKVLWYTPGIRLIVRKKVNEALMKAFGGKLRFLIIGGAAFNKEIERCLRQIKFPYTVGYGMTECAPLITYEDWWNFKPRSCGKAIDSMQIRIKKKDGDFLNREGEVEVKGECVMMGYYKNEDATKSSFTEDGWLRTGDLGYLDLRGNLVLRGRSKNMILRPDGQNIYPEEIEDKLNAQPLVLESLVTEQDGRLVALIVPDMQAAKEQKKSEEEINAQMESNLNHINKIMPPFCKVSTFKLMDKEFEKTPKRSIKRFLYV